MPHTLNLDKLTQVYVESNFSDPPFKPCILSICSKFDLTVVVGMIVDAIIVTICKLEWTRTYIKATKVFFKETNSEPCNHEPGPIVPRTFRSFLESLKTLILGILDLL